MVCTNHDRSLLKSFYTQKGGSTLTEKELKKLNRYQLLELLVMQAQQTENLQKKVDELEAQLEAQELDFSRLGSISEAAVHISGVFEAAQKAADLYLDSARKQADDVLAFARHRAASIIIQAEEKARMMTNTLEAEMHLMTGKRNTDG